MKKSSSVSAAKGKSPAGKVVSKTTVSSSRIGTAGKATIQTAKQTLATRNAIEDNNVQNNGVQKSSVQKSASQKPVQKAEQKTAQSKASSGMSLKMPLKQSAPKNTALSSDKNSENSSKSQKSSFSAGLSPEQMLILQQRLLDLKVEIKNALEGKSQVFNSSQYNESLIKGDDAEVAEKQRQSNAHLQELDMYKNRLILVDRALKKIEFGVYGICEETEEPIGFERLMVVPWARYGVKIQEVRERKMRDFRVSRLRSEV